MKMTLMGKVFSINSFVKFHGKLILEPRETWASRKLKKTFSLKEKHEDDDDVDGKGMNSYNVMILQRN